MSPKGKRPKLTEEDRRFVQQLYDEHEKMLWQYCQWMVDSAAAEDAVQDTFVAVINHVGKLRDYEPGHLRGWLLVTARNNALAILARRKRVAPTSEPPETAGADPTPGWDAAVHAETLLGQAAQTFDPKERGVLAVSLAVHEKWISYPAAADQLTMKIPAVRQAVHRMVNENTGYLRQAVLAAYLHQKKGAGCPDAQKIVAGRRLDRDLKETLLRHVAGCEEFCKKTRDRLPKLADVLTVLPVLLPPDHLRERVLHEIDLAAATTPSPTTGANTGAGRTRLPLSKSLAGTAAVATAGALTYAVATGHHPPARTDAAPQRSPAAPAAPAAANPSKATDPSSPSSAQPPLPTSGSPTPGQPSQQTTTSITPPPTHNATQHQYTAPVVFTGPATMLFTFGQGYPTGGSHPRGSTTTYTIGLHRQVGQCPTSAPCAAGPMTNATTHNAEGDLTITVVPEGDTLSLTGQSVDSSNGQTQTYTATAPNDSSRQSCFANGRFVEGSPSNPTYAGTFTLAMPPPPGQPNHCGF